ncbi:MAG: hypothetical protein PHI02_05490 [Sulfurovaceae bacterium]|nr:hypothetical protein [Sulfurovaceae bacterium]
MNKIIRLFAVLICMVVFSTANANDLTGQTINVFLGNIDKAIVAKNTSLISDTLSEHVIIVVNVKMQGQNRVLKLTKTEYVSMLEQGWSACKNYKYARTNVSIKIKSNRAFVTSDVKESMTVQGKKISGISKEETTIELVDGQPLVTKIVGYTSM